MPFHNKKKARLVSNGNTLLYTVSKIHQFGHFPESTVTNCPGWGTRVSFQMVEKLKNGLPYGICHNSWSIFLFLFPAAEFGTTFNQNHHQIVPRRYHPPVKTQPLPKLRIWIAKIEKTTFS